MLSVLLANEFSQASEILDIGAGSGEIASQIMSIRPDLKIDGIDIKIREDSSMPIGLFNGESIKHSNNSYDYCLLVDVLHHTHNPEALLAEAARVARIGVVIKDHLCENKIDFILLCLMDIVGNWSYGVKITYNYLSEKKWLKLFSLTNLKIKNKHQNLGIYPQPFRMLFDQNLHVIFNLAKAKN